MNFDRLAPHYRWIEALFAGGRLQRCRTALLDAIPAPQCVLIYGEGNGRFLVELLRRFPHVRVTVVEASAVMIDLARARLRREGMETAVVTFEQADALAWEPPTEAFDLLVTCFFLDCFKEEQLRLLIPRIARAGKPEARWLAADFNIPASGVQRLVSRLLLALLYAFFRRAAGLSAHELVDLAPHLHGVGFTCERRKEAASGLLYSALWKRGGMVSLPCRIT